MNSLSNFYKTLSLILTKNNNILIWGPFFFVWFLNEWKIYQYKFLMSKSFSCSLTAYHLPIKGHSNHLKLYVCQTKQASLFPRRYYALWPWIPSRCPPKPRMNVNWPSKLTKNHVAIYAVPLWAMGIYTLKNDNFNIWFL